MILLDSYRGFLKKDILYAMRLLVGSGFKGRTFTGTAVLEEIIQDVTLEDNSLAETQRREALMSGESKKFVRLN